MYGVAVILKRKHVQVAQKSWKRAEPCQNLHEEIGF